MEETNMQQEVKQELAAFMIVVALVAAVGGPDSMLEDILDASAERITTLFE